MTSAGQIAGRIRGLYLAVVGVLGDVVPAAYRWDARREARLARDRYELSAPDSVADLTGHEESVFSQNGEDGVIAEIMRRVGEGGRFLVEIGASDGEENCTRALVDQGWEGIWVEADPLRAERAAAVAPAVRVVDRPVYRDDVVRILQQEGVPPEPGVLSVDIDGDDLGVLRACLGVLRPRLVVVEYNSSFRPGQVWSWTGGGGWDGTFRHGASLSALVGAAGPLGYRLVHCDRMGVNAFFVRSDLCRDEFGPARDAARVFRPPRFGLHPFGHVRGRRAVRSMPRLDPEQLSLVRLRDPRFEQWLGAAGESGREFLYSVVVENESGARLTGGGPHAVNVSSRWLPHTPGGDIPPDTPRSALPVSVPHHGARRLLFRARMSPRQPAGTSMTLRTTLAQEGVFWLEHLGGEGSVADLEITA